MLWLKQNNILIRNALFIKNNNKLNELTDKMISKKFCFKFIQNASKPLKEQICEKINLYEFSNSIDNDLALIEDLFIHTAPNIFENFMKQYFNEFYIFSTQILNNIIIEQIEYYDINELIYLKKLCKKIDFYETYTDVLNNINSATKNNNVLTLAYKISSK